jgi:AraC-like DNA-binding protein
VNSGRKVQVAAGPRSRAADALVPAAWRACLRQLLDSTRSSARGPHWWSPAVGFFGTVETRARGNSYRWDGIERCSKGAPPFFLCQLTLGGHGCFEWKDEPARLMTPGSAFFVSVPSRHRYYLPPSSPGWTFCWVLIYHPYVLERASQRIAQSGPCLEVEPDGAFVASALRLVRGAFKKDFRDGVEVELALIEFVLAYERLALRSADPEGERERLLEAVRQRIVAQPMRAVKVEALAAEYGMTRSHFSHFFRECTGLTPGRFMTETRIREAARLLVEARLPLKQVAAACGFSNVNHFSKVFRRFHHRSPGAYQRTLA